MTVTITHRDAVLSDDDVYRYVLTRSWSPRMSTFRSYPLTWVMLNPSTADATIDDPTIKRCIAFTDAWGASSMYVVNLYALRSPHPSALKTHPDPFGSDNFYWLKKMTKEGPVVAAWGVHKMPEDAYAALLPAAQENRMYALGLTLDGHPKHPLARGRHRIPDDAPMRPYLMLRASLETA